jgi:hypothetical protein
VKKLTKKNIIKYKSLYKESPNTLTPLNTLLPAWYKKIPPWKDNVIKILPKNHITVKKCVPFLESMLVGYALTLPADILVDTDTEELITWATSYSVVLLRKENVNNLVPVPSDCFELEFVWVVPASFKIPKGYSVIVTHPFNRHDLPFVTLTGVVDGEFVMTGGGELPFFLKKGFKGIIPKGTPIAQIIPFKQENWKLDEDESVLDEGFLNGKKTRASAFTGWYKNSIWKRKTYE